MSKTAVALAAAAIAVAGGMAGSPLGLASPPSEFRPGETDPIANPSRLTLFHDEQAFLSVGVPTIEITARPDDGSLRRWSASERLTRTCDYAGRRLARGRIVDPVRDQVVCATPFKVVVQSDPPRVLELPEAGVSSARSVAVAVGDLDRAADDDGVLHAEIVVAYYLRNQHARILVLDWKLHVLARADTEHEARGDIAVAVGDYVGDGRQDVVLASADAAPNLQDNAERTGMLHLETFRFVAHEGKGELQKASEVVDRAPAPYTSVALVSADFDGDGLDEIALAGYVLKAPPRPIHLSLFRAKLGLALSRVAEKDLVEPALGTYFDLEAGLFRFDPSAGYTLDRRQLALAFVDASRQAAVIAYDVEQNSTRIEERGRYLAPGTVARGSLGPGLAGGNFVGTRDPHSVSMQIGLHVPVAASGDQSFPRFIALAVDPQMRLSEAARLEWPQHPAAGVLWTQELVPADVDGRSFYLGAPVHITVSELVQPHYIVGEPPKHVDYLPLDPNHREGEWAVVNVSGYPYFTVALNDAEERVLENTLTDTTSWSIGGSAAFSSFQTVSAGFGDIASTTLSSSVRVAVGYDYDQNTSRTNSKYATFRTEETEETNVDDQVRASVRLIDVWRYRVYGLQPEAEKTNGFYEVLLPGPVVEVAGGGLNQDWYNPQHVNNNILSYPSLKLPPPPEGDCSRPFGPDSRYFPSDVGCFAPLGEKPRRVVMNDSKVLYWDGNQASLQLAWSTMAGKEAAKTFNSSLRESVDVSFAVEASVDAKVTSGTVRRSFDFNFQNNNSWGGSAVSRQSLSQSKGIVLTKPAEGERKQAYAFEPAIYVTEQGTVKVAHAVDPVGSAVGAPWWRAQYGHRPDPGLNLPNRFTFFQGTWQLTEGDAGKWARQVFLRKPEPNPATGTFDLLPLALTAGEGVNVVARAYNFGLDEQATFAVLFEYEEVDPESDHTSGERKRIGSTVTTVGPLGSREVSVSWDTRGLGGIRPGTARYYRIFVTLDPEDRVRGEVHELRRRDGTPEPGGNNEGIWPWTGGVAVYSPERQSTATVEDVSVVAGSLRVTDDQGRTLDAAALSLREPYRVRATLRSAREVRGNRVALFYEKTAPDAEWRLLAFKTIPGLVAGDNYVWARSPHAWRPAAVAVRVLERPDDVAPGNATAQILLRP